MSLRAVSKHALSALVAAHGSVSAAARAMGAPRSTFRNALMREEIARGGSEDFVARFVAEVLDKAPVSAVAPCLFAPPADNSRRSLIDACLHLSDIHYGAVQASDEVEGINSYSPEICARRLTNLFQVFLEFIHIQRRGYDIRRLYILMTGDYISGDIHQELSVTNAFPVPVQSIKCAELLVSLIAGIAAHFESVVVYVCTDDNHGRLTRKPQAKQAGTNNWGYVIASWMRHGLSAHTGVTVEILPRPWSSVACGTRRYLLTHGHHVTGWAGFPYYGIERMVAREAMKRLNMDDIRKFHRVILGHWHVPLAHKWYWIGGSVSGTDAYDHGRGRMSEPCQVSWLVHPKHGEFARTEWALER